MKNKEQLKLIQQLAGLTQEQLARRFDVTFATLNRWINGCAKPHAKQAAKIEELFKELTGQKEIPEDQLTGGN